MSNPLLLTLQLMFGVTSKKIGKYKLGRLLQYTCRQILSSSILNPTELTDICRVVYKSVQNCIVANTCKLPTPPLEFVKEPRRKQWNIFLVPLGNDNVLTESLYMYLPLYLVMSPSRADSSHSLSWRIFSSARFGLDFSLQLDQLDQVRCS